jgi:hypothetical protein
MNEQSKNNISVDLETGAKKGVKLQRFDLIPHKPLWELAEHYGRGVNEKYSERNWEKGYDWSKSYSAMMRHAVQFWAGENFDRCTKNCFDENQGSPCFNHTQSKHLIAVAWHALTLAEFMDTHPEKDDRVHKK